MNGLNLFSGAMGKNILQVNTDDAAGEEVEKMLDMTMSELLDYIRKMTPKAIMKMKVSTILDIFVNMDEADIAELSELCEEEDEPE